MYLVKIDIFKNSKCPVCGRAEKAERDIETVERLVWLCGQNTVNVNPRRPLPLSIDDVYHRLSKCYKMLLKSSFVVVFKHNAAEVSLFKGGRMLIKNVKNEEEALEVYRNVMKQLEVES